MKGESIWIPQEITAVAGNELLHKISPLVPAEIQKSRTNPGPGKVEVLVDLQLARYSMHPLETATYLRFGFIVIPKKLKFMSKYVNLMAFKTGITSAIISKFIPSDPKMILHNICKICRIIFGKVLSYHGNNSK